MQVEFDWNPVKAASNLAKHGVSFEEAMAVFADPLALSRLDENHGATEERWVTMGEAAVGFCWRFTPMWSWQRGASSFALFLPVFPAGARRGSIKKA